MIICISNSEGIGIQQGSSNNKNGTYEKINSIMVNDIIN